MNGGSKPGAPAGDRGAEVQDLVSANRCESFCRGCLSHHDVDVDVRVRDLGSPSRLYDGAWEWVGVLRKDVGRADSRTRFLHVDEFR